MNSTNEQTNLSDQGVIDHQFEVLQIIPERLPRGMTRETVIQDIKERLTRRYSGKGVKHEFYVKTEELDGGVKLGHKPVLALSNDDDGHYIQYFPNWEHLGVFIVQAVEAAIDTYGVPPEGFVDKVFELIAKQDEGSAK